MSDSPFPEIPAEGWKPSHTAEKSPSDPPRDRRILVWFKGHAIYGKEHGWFTAQYSPNPTDKDDPLVWRIGVNIRTARIWVSEDDIGGWHELPPDLKNVGP